MFPVAPLVLFVLFAAAAARPEPGPELANHAAPTDSLQELLRRARAERRALFARLEPQVRLIVDKLEALGGPRPKRELDRIHAEIDALGPDATPLFLPFLDPGEGAGTAARFRAGEITAALAGRCPPAIIDGLIALANEGTPAGRVNAVHVLGHSPERDKAGASLTVLFQVAEGDLLTETVRALARLGGPENLALICSALDGDDRKVIAEVLDALAEAGSIEAAPRVLALARRPTTATKVLAAIDGYYRRCPAAVDEETVQSLLELALNDAGDVEGRVALLDTIARLEPSLEAKQRRRIEELTESSNLELREAALILLAKLGDRSARRTLLRSYDEVVEEDPRYGPAYERRGDVLMRLGDHRDAAEDYQRSIESLQRDARFIGKPLWIKLARAHVLDGRLRPAFEALRDGELGSSLLEGLRDDPDFAELVGHSRYGKLFE